MFLILSHTDWPIYKITRQIVMECYSITRNFPKEEKFVITQQITRAALSVHFNLAEGASRNSPKERKRFYEIARSSVVEIDTALDVATGLLFCDPENTKSLGNLMIEAFAQLTNLIESNNQKIQIEKIRLREDV